LEAETDAEKWSAVRDLFKERGAETAFIERANHGGVVADSGQNDRVCATQFARLSDAA
jgi:hypothetical protein